MTTQQKLEDELIKRGMFESQASEVIELAKPKIEEIVEDYTITWDSPCDDYPKDRQAVRIGRTDIGRTRVTQPEPQLDLIRDHIDMRQTFGRVRADTQCRVPQCVGPFGQDRFNGPKQSEFPVAIGNPSVVERDVRYLQQNDQKP